MKNPHDLFYQHRMDHQGPSGTLLPSLVLGERHKELDTETSLSLSLPQAQQPCHTSHDYHHCHHGGGTSELGTVPYS